MHDPKRIAAIMSRVVIQSNGCWEWTGAKSINGYSVAAYQGRQWFLHRLFYEHFREAIPEGKQIDHLCRNRVCINPAHLEVVTSRENSLRAETVQAKNLRKTHCPAGHPYDKKNTLIVGTTGERQCRECSRRRAREYYWRNREDCIEKAKARSKARASGKGSGSYQKEKTHCPQGHPYEGDNLYVDKTGRRHCRTCGREKMRASRQKDKQ